MDTTKKKIVELLLLNNSILNKTMEKLACGPNANEVFTKQVKVNNDMILSLIPNENIED